MPFVYRLFYREFFMMDFLYIKFFIPVLTTEKNRRKFKLQYILAGLGGPHVLGIGIGIFLFF